MEFGGEVSSFAASRISSAASREFSETKSLQARVLCSIEPWLVGLDQLIVSSRFTGNFQRFEYFFI